MSPPPEALTMSEAANELTMLACGIYGHPLPKQHGAPLRLVAPGQMGFYSVKWVDRLEVLAEEVLTTGATLARNRLSR